MASLAGTERRRSWRNVDTREGATGMGSEQLGDLRTEEWRDRMTGGGGNSVIIGRFCPNP